MATPDQDVYALINGFMLGTRQVRLIDYSDLLSSAPRRGANKPQPLTDNIRFYPRRGGEKIAQLQIQVHGKWTEDGAVATGNPAENAHVLAAELAAEDADGGLLGVGLETVTFELHVWDTLYTGDIQVHGLFEVNFPEPSIAVGTLEVSAAPSLIGASGS